MLARSLVPSSSFFCVGARSASPRPAPVSRTMLAVAVLATWNVPHPCTAGEIPFSTQKVIDLSFDDSRSVQTVDIDGDGDLDILAVAQGNQDDVGWFENTAGDGSVFTERLVSDGLVNPGWARAGDLDGDGDPDVVASDLGESGNPGKVVWFENTGVYGAAWPQVTIDIMNGVEPVELGDLDGDGLLDVIASSFLVDDIRWYENTGGAFAAFRRVDDAIKGKNLAIADVDRDGDLDVAVGAPNGFAPGDSGKLAWLENPGPAAIFGVFAWPRHPVNATPFDGARGVCVADLDLDGDLDLAGAADGTSDDAVAWFENTGNDTTFTTHTLDTAFVDPKVVHCRDLDEDGDVDLLAVSNGGSGVVWYENPREDTGWPVHTIQLVFTNGQNVWAGDIDGDGRTDVAAVSRNDIVSWWRNEEIQRNAAFPRIETVDADHVGATAVALGDVDGDGSGELVAAATTEAAITVYARDSGLDPDPSAWTHLADVSTSAAGVRALSLGDVDRDGDLDVVAALDGTTDALHLFRNTAGTGLAWSVAGTLGAVDGPRQLLLADLDGDGDLDALASEGDGDAFAWFENDGSSGPWAKTVVVDGLLVHDGAHGLAVADVDRDGDLDVLATAENDAEVLYLANTLGDGSTWSLTTIDTSVVGPRGLAAGDLDGDGDTDVVVADAGGGDLRVFADSSGDGTTWVPLADPATNTAVGAESVELADLDGDGDLDIVAAEGGNDSANWYENTSGDGTTWASHSAISTAGGAEYLAIGDPERNGLRGVALVAGAASDVLWAGNLGGQFALPTTDVAPLALTNGARAAIFRLTAVHNGRVGENDLGLEAIELEVVERPSGQVLNTAETQTLLQAAELWLDDGDGIWEDGIDTLVASAS
ncbi:MAG: VCBS repeat-containing protein, partial [Holophagales bacterium]|nr:VCBS repeat-containing protein [Holophagales bacterium]